MSSTAGAIRAGRAFVELFADDSKLKGTLRSADKHLRSWGVSVTKFGASLFAAGLSTVTSFAAAAKQFASTGATLADMSKRTGFAASTLSALDFAAAQSGASLADVEVGLKNMQRLLDAAGGKKTALSDLLESGEASRALKTLGIDLAKLKALKPEDQFFAIADALDRLPNDGTRAAAALKIFGKSGTTLLPLLEGGSAAIKQLMDQAVRLGRVMSNEDVAAADALDDAIEQLTGQFKALVVSLGATVAPVLQQVLGQITPWVAGVIDWVKANRELVASMFKIAVAVGAAGAAIVAIGASLVAMGAAVASAKLLFGTFVVGGVVLLKKALVGLAFGGFKVLVFYIRSSLSIWNALWQGFKVFAGGALLAPIKAIGKAFATSFSLAKEAFGGIVDALATGDFTSAFNIAVAGMKAIWAELVAGFKTAWVDFSDWLTSIWDDWKEVIIGVAAVVAVAFTGPVGIVVALFVGASAIILKNWDNLVNTLSDIWLVFTTALMSFPEVAHFLRTIWSGLEGTWFKVVGVLSQIWEDLTKHFKSGGLGVKGFLIDVWTKLQLIWIRVIAGITKAWNNMLAFMRSGWIKFGAFFAKIGSKLGIVDVSIEDIEKKEGRLLELEQKRADAQNAAAEKEAQANAKDLFAKQAEDEFNLRIANLQDELKRGVARELGKGNIERDREAGQQELRDLLEKQRGDKELAGMFGVNQAFLDAVEQLRPLGLGHGGGAGESGNAPVGTFDPNALRGLGANTVWSEQLAELKKLVKLDKDVLDELRNAGIPVT